MALFGKNPNETAFAGGKKHWADVIKNSGPGELLLWRQPEEDFNTNSTLIVMPGEEAVFVKGGAIEQTFDNGTYKLSTENYPFISRLRNAFTGGVSTFNAVVYFVRKAVSMQINWGTKAPMTIWDDMIAQSIKLTAFGSYSVSVGSPEVFLTKLLGNNIPFLARDELENYFDGQLQETIVSCIVQTLEDKATMIFRVISKLRDFSAVISPIIQDVLDEYGIELKSFSVIAINPEEEIRVAYNELQRRAQWGRAEKQAEALGDKDRMDILGNDWGRQQAANILGTLAENPGSGGVAAAGAGVGMGMAAGNIFAGMSQQMFSPMQSQTPVQPTAPQPSGRFTQKPSGEGSAAAQNGGGDDPVSALKKLKEMFDLGLIEQAEYDSKKSEIINRM
jgi:membrane protease subunit (stomatin/prohibitin family)